MNFLSKKTESDMNAFEKWWEGEIAQDFRTDKGKPLCLFWTVKSYCAAAWEASAKNTTREVFKRVLDTLHLTPFLEEGDIEDG